MIKTFAVIGDPIEHSMSPNIHNAAFRELGMEATYIAYRIPRGELEEGVQSLKRVAVSGFNVTIPHKVEIMKHLDRTDEACSIIGAANTVTNDGGVLKGHNTDMDGFLDPIRKRDIGVRDEAVFLLGAGGAARAVVAGLAKERAGTVTIANRTAQGARELARFAEKLGLDARAAPIGQVRDMSGYGLVINATSVGLGGEPTPINTERISSSSVVYDIVYMPMNTDLVKKSRQRGATVILGYEMLLGQAARAFEIWHGREAPHDAMKRALVGAGGQ